MHQPDYRHPETGHFTLPWALLHALKDYPDMASHLERHPAIRCTVNFVPVLLAQIEDYCDQLATRQWRDPLLRILAWPNPDHLEQADRNWILDMAFRCHAPTMLEPFAPYRRLRDLLAFVRDQDADSLEYLSAQYYADLATWYVLAWSGESLRRGTGPFATLMAKGGSFDMRDREALVGEMRSVLEGLIPRYRALADRGQIELSCTPAHHPLAPLMLDFGVAREAPLDDGEQPGENVGLRRAAKVVVVHASSRRARVSARAAETKPQAPRPGKPSPASRRCVPSAPRPPATCATRGRGRAWSALRRAARAPST